jgi:hypothetical protein
VSGVWYKQKLHLKCPLFLYYFNINLKVPDVCKNAHCQILWKCVKWFLSYFVCTVGHTKWGTERFDRYSTCLKIGKNGMTAVCIKMIKGCQDSWSSGWYMNSGPLEIKAWVVTLQQYCKVLQHNPLISTNACSELKMMSTGVSVA